MVTDMGGAAAVAGLMYALAARKAKVNAVGILGLVENMPDGNAQRPGDVVTTMSGQTIEVINTDAEGRLVLADALWYCQDRFKPKFMVDLATLTGAIIIALGKDVAGLFSNNDELAEQLAKASKASGEPLWRMPLPPQYDKLIESPIADMKNVGTRHGGSITAALFIQKFVNGLPWAHLDIASTAHKPTRPYRPSPAARPASACDCSTASSRTSTRAEPSARRSREAMFYHLERSGVEDALPELLEKTLERGKRALVRSTDADLLGRLDERLWSWREESFLAHGLSGEPMSPRQPILLTTGEENENGADFLFVLDEPPAGLERFERCVLMFSGNDEAGLNRARGLWKSWKSAGATVAYHQQTEEGRWARRA